MSEQTSPLHDPTARPAAAAPRPVPQLRLEAFVRDWSMALTAVTLVAIVVFAGFLRLTHNNWDDYGHLHPDERFITQISGDVHAPSGVANYFDTDTSALNPYNIRKPDGSKQTTFVYGTIPLFLNKFVAAHLERLSLGQLRNYDNYDEYNLSGRALSALFDMGTVVFVFLLARQLADRRVGLLAALLYAASAFPIQNAHFFVVDPFVAFFATFTLYFAVRSARQGGNWNFAMAGAGAGLAAACKITAVSLLPIVLLAVGVRAWPGVKPYVAPWWYGNSRRYAREQDGRKLDGSAATLIIGSLIALVAAFIAFRIAMPYAFKTPDLADIFVWNVGKVWKFPVPYPDIMNHQWLGDQVDQQKLLSGNAAFPPDVQWIGRSKWLWPAQQMIAWGMGPALGITAWLGVVFAAVWAFRKRDGAWLIPLAWVLGYFVFMGAQFSLYMRYFLPLYPTLAVLAAFLLYRTWWWAGSADPFATLGRAGARLSALRPGVPYVARAAVGVVIALTVLMGLAFYHIYTEPVTRVSASKWIYENVPAGSVIGHEHWDDSVPYQVPGVEPRTYGSVEFQNFNADSPQRVQQLLDDIDQVDYIALSSRRLSGTITRVPAEWPITSRYYETLETGELGFEKVAEFTSYPSVFVVELDDTAAEESYSVYDHPKVSVYKKTDAYSSDRAREVLHADAFVVGVSALPGQAGQNAVRYTPDVLARQQAGGTWSSIFHPGNVINAHPLFFWLLAMEVAAFALVPLAVVGLKGLPDRGFLLTKPLGVLGLAYLAYAPASYGLSDFTRGEIVGALAIMVAVGAATGVRWRREIVGWVKERWRLILFAEALFLLAFLFAYWLRLQNPDLWHGSRGGEKPMDFAYLNGVIKTTDLTQGAIDPWDAGGYLNYYYFGQFIAATFAKLTGIVPEVAYNLIVPMFFSIAAAAAFSLTYNLADATRQLMKRRPGGIPIGVRGPIIAGVLGVFLVLVAGNLRAVGVFEQNLSQVSAWHSDVPLLGGIVAMVGGLKEVVLGDASWRHVVYGYDWWAPSRALDVTDTKEVQPITEFPFWTFLFADLHAHLMAIPFSLTAAALGLAAVLNFSRINRDDPRAREIASWVLVIVLAVVVGSLRWINSWDYPPFLALGAVALIIGERAKEGRLNLRALCVGVLKAAVMGALTWVFFARFAKNYNMFYSGFQESDQTTALGDYLSHFGVVLFLMTGFVLFQLSRSITRAHAIRRAFFGSSQRRTPMQIAPVMAAIVLGSLIVIWLGTTERWGVTMLAIVGIIAVLIVSYRELRSAAPTAPLMLFVYAMIGLGLVLCGFVEIWTLDGDIGRMNTVFKFYLHVWMLWGVAAAFSLWYVFAVLRPQERLFRRIASVNGWLVVAPRYAFGALAVVLLALTLVFPYVGTRARIHERFAGVTFTGNNGMEYMDTAVYDDRDTRTGKGGPHTLDNDRDGINWVRANVDGSPTIIEGIAPLYHFGSRVSIYTGLPAVLGWDWHQTQQRQRFQVQVQERLKDVNDFYTTSDVQEARDIIRKYDVQWVIVGDVEHNYYPSEGIAKINSGLDGSLELAYQNPGMQIWHVIPREDLVQASSQ